MTAFSIQNESLVPNIVQSIRPENRSTLSWGRLGCLLAHFQNRLSNKAVWLCGAFVIYPIRASLL